MRLLFRINFLVLLLCFVGNSACERQRITESKKNSPPTITSVDILPKEPTQENQLSLTIQGKNPDRDPINYRYQWMKNDEEILAENKNVLENGRFRKGDLIRVKVTASDGKDDGKPFSSDPVKIVNSPPVVQEVRIEPKVAYANDNLKVLVKSSDIDGDEIRHTYQWERNGVILSEETKEVLEKGLSKKKDSFIVTVTPSDGEVPGTPKRSEPVVIFNSPPIIISSPPTRTEGSSYTYRVEANDPDGDPLAFTLKLHPKGMEIDKQTGLVRWEIRKEDKGNHPVEIEVSDDAGAKTSQQYEIKVDLR